MKSGLHIYMLYFDLSLFLTIHIHSRNVIEKRPRENKNKISQLSHSEGTLVSSSIKVLPHYKYYVSNMNSRTKMNIFYKVLVCGHDWF